MNVQPITGAPAIDLSKEPLRLAPNQRETWRTIDKPEGIPFEEGAQIILDAAKADGQRTDQGVGDLSSWAFGPMDDGSAALATIPMPGRERHMVPLREHAFGQVCKLIGAPSDYIRKLPGKLQMACVNYGLHTVEDRSVQIRKAGDFARALVSDRYAALDDALVLEVMDSVLRAAGLMSITRIRSAAVGTTTVLRMTFGESVEIASAKVGDIVECGLDLVNGEVGNRALSLTPITYRLLCKNGMRRNDAGIVHRLRHVGDPKRLEEAFRDAVPAALAEGRGLRQQMAKAVDHLVDDLLSEFDSLRAFGLTANESRDVARDVMADRSLALPTDTSEWGKIFANVHTVSAYDVMNGVTHLAQGRGTDRRLELEEAASAYLYKATK
jgi:hypothetical protein